MCFSPKIPKPEAIEQKQAAKAPITRSGERRKTGVQGSGTAGGRAGTILTDGGTPSAPTAKKTLLGQ